MQLTGQQASSRQQRLTVHWVQHDWADAGVLPLVPQQGMCSCRHAG